MARLGTLLASTIALLGAALLVVGPAQGATLTVCPSGCTYSTITAAVAAADPGDTVTVGAGTYVENGIAVTKAITITGAGPGQTIVDGGGQATSPRVGIFQIRPSAAATSGTGSITVSGMTVRNPSKQGSFYMNFSIGMKVATTGVTDITLDDLDVIGTDDAALWNYGVYADGGAPISSQERAAPALVIKNSSFSKTAFNNIGVDAWFGPVTIQNNDLTESVASGKSAIIVLNEYTAAQITEPVVVSGNRSDGRLFYLSNIPVPDKPGWADVTVRDNTATNLGPTDPGIYVDTNTSLTGAQFHNGTVRVTGNTLTGSGCPTGSAGVVVGGMTDDASISGNTIVGVATGVATKVVKGSAPGSVDVHDNALTGCGSAAPSTGIALSGALGSAALAANDVVGWSTAVAMSDGEAGTVTSTHNRYFADTVGLDNGTTTTFGSTDDWWGCQHPDDPSDSFCSTVSGPAELTSWLALEARPQPAAGTDGTVDVTTGQSVPVTFVFVSTDGDGSQDATGLPDIFDALPLALSSDRGTVTGPDDLGAGHSAVTTYTAPATAGADTATGTPDRVTLPSGEVVQGEPVSVLFAVSAVQPPDGEDDSGTDDGGDTGGSGTDSGTGGVVAGPTASGSLPDTGSPVELWQPVLAGGLLLVGLALLAATTAPAGARSGRHRR